MYFTQKQNGNEVIITKISFTTNIAMLDEKKKDQQTQPMTIRSFLTSRLHPSNNNKAKAIYTL